MARVLSLGRAECLIDGCSTWTGNYASVFHLAAEATFRRCAIAPLLSIIYRLCFRNSSPSLFFRINFLIVIWLVLWSQNFSASGTKLNVEYKSLISFLIKKKIKYKFIQSVIKEPQIAKIIKFEKGCVVARKSCKK